jgi:hypothetical protein
MGFYTRNGGRIGKVIATPTGRFDLVAAQVLKVLPTGSQIEWTTPGTYTWTVPAGVTQIFGVLISGGGGGAASDIGSSTSSPTNGGASYIQLNGTNYLEVRGGTAGSINGNAGATGGAGGIPWNAYAPGSAPSFAQTGKSGAAGPTRINSYIGCGGGGAAKLDSTTAPNGTEYDWGGSGGYGSSLLGGNGDAGGAGTNTAEGPGGIGGLYGGGGGGGRDGMGGGGGGMIWFNYFPVTPGSTLTIVVGAGGDGANKLSTQRRGGAGRGGAVRILWGTLRLYPSTNIGNI